MKYLALLRGINVGGKNVLPMAKLRSMLTGAGLKNVQTYIQSGNILFDAPRQSKKELQSTIDGVLKKGGYEVKSLILTANQMEKIVLAAPKLFAKDKKSHLCDVVFLFSPLTPTVALGSFTIRDEVDTVTKGPGVVYSSRLKSKVARSGLSKITRSPAYKNMTIRNWNTTKKLHSLLLENK